jgi:hypothetical protein
MTYPRILFSIADNDFATPAWMSLASASKGDEGRLLSLDNEGVEFLLRLLNNMFCWLRVLIGGFRYC